MSSSRKSVQRGQSITFRVPSDTPDHLLKQLSQLKETERRNFSSKIAQFVLEGVNKSLVKDKETVTIPLPKSLTKEQRNWIKHEHSEALIGSILYQLMMDPVRATALLASLNSNAYDIDDALYLQEEAAAKEEPVPPVEKDKSVMPETPLEVDGDDDLDDLNLDNLQVDLQNQTEEEVQEEDDDDLLDDFLSRMNR
ncbi:hypothetical protein SAMN05192559_101793 [Halobacillus karajensis]|uniref:Uncharacterized protein n=1 Tax=Halobacillus karajensis TaxID=195088 RepID=A0A059NVH3_9BACI|nr:hypothetical protein [Halobacillus karajensis]CDQ18594.1 hypothetical protein BN982_00868 [Halobacillus karajensis]CDQ23334.1 hypothetical protein BN983_01560 [Halobacillus karajensis]CDQ26816.1 hypothetical protein BN981_01040 [Halobacillus karajensis]SEH49421.1 hypothetical protein SAMN05192559_101793 [Halobacillus karajensis]